MKLSKQQFSNGIYFINGLRERGLLLHYSYNETKPFLKIGIYQVGGQVVNYFNRDLDILLIGKFFGSEILGGYSLAKQLVQRPMQIINPVISKVASPVLALLQFDKKQLKIKYLSFLNTVATINFIVYGILSLLAFPAVVVLYGKEFLDITLLVQILSVYMFLRSVGNPVGSLVVATGKTDLEFYWNLFVLFVTPIAIYRGAQYSIEVVALSMLMASLILLYPFWRFLIFKLCGATAKEFFLSFVPRFGRVYSLVKLNN